MFYVHTYFCVKIPVSRLTKKWYDIFSHDQTVDNVKIQVFFSPDSNFSAITRRSAYLPPIFSSMKGSNESILFGVPGVITGHKEIGQEWNTGRENLCHRHFFMDTQKDVDSVIITICYWNYMHRGAHWALTSKSFAKNKTSAIFPVFPHALQK